MGGLIGGKNPNGTAIIIETQTIAPNDTGVLKKSTVKVAHLRQAIVLGVRIGSGQTITDLYFDTFDVRTRADADTTAALERAFPIPAGVPERWHGFALLEDDLPNPGQFETRFGLAPFPQQGQFQLVPFVVAPAHNHFASGAYLVAVSVVTSPEGPAELRRR
jgi:hypothetical protein